MPETIQPTLLSLVQTDDALINASVVHYSLTFSEPVTGVEQVRRFGHVRAAGRRNHDGGAILGDDRLCRLAAILQHLWGRLRYGRDGRIGARAHAAGKSQRRQQHPQKATSAHCANPGLAPKHKPD